MDWLLANHSRLGKEKRGREECGDWRLIRRQLTEQTGVDLQSWRQCRIVAGARAANKASQCAPTPTPTPTASPIATTRSHLASQLFCGIIAVTFVPALLVVVVVVAVVILVILVVVLADCAAIVFKNEIKMVLAIADLLQWWRHNDRGCGDGASLGHTSSCLSPSLCPVLGNKSRKNCGLQSRISIAQLFIIASAFPPGALCSAFPLLCSSLLFFFSSDTFTLPFGHLSPLWPFSPATSGHPSDTGHGDVFISCSSFISFCSFFFCFCFVLFLFLFHTSENICICARLLHVLPLPPFPSSHLLPRLLPLCLPQSFLLPLLSLPPFLRPLHLLPFGPRLLFYFVLICVFVCFVLCFAVLFIFDSFSPRFSNLLICELLCSHYNSFSSVSLPLLLPIRWEFKRTTPPPLSAWRLTGVLWIPFNCEMRREIKIFLNNVSNRNNY